MLLKNLFLQNFRTYKKTHFSFEKTNIIIGRNTIGKTNILEGTYFLSNGKSFRAENDKDSIRENEDFAKIEGDVIENDEITKLTVILHTKNNHFYKRYLVNNIPKRQIDFVSKILTVLFTPSDIEIITDSPSLRRNYFNSVLSQASSIYRRSLSIYEKALRHRNKMLYLIKEGKRLAQKVEFEYWDNLLIENGTIITEERNKLIEYINNVHKKIFNFEIYYDKSTITIERINKYFETEQKTGITLIGPQRDEFAFYFPASLPASVNRDESQGGPSSKRQVKEFGSRGEQRLTILQLKMLEIEYLKKQTGKNPVLLLDDIFSELDSKNIDKVLHLIDLCQTIITTTHKEFIPKEILKKVNIIELGEK